jgi:1-hydroxycarotenoid 3,4-desaturase
LRKSRNRNIRLARAPVIIIGAGMGGLAAAALLAAKGVEVLVLEKGQAPGGKLRLVGGVDSGPTVFTMRWVFEDIFRRAGADFGAALTLAKADVLARHWWSAAERLDLFADLGASAGAIGDFAGQAEARRFLAFSAEAKGFFETLKAPFLESQRGGLPALMASAKLADLWRLRPFETMWSALGRHFHDPRLRQLFGRYATYCGSSPFAAAATLMLVAHVEQDGVWMIEGGMHRLAQAFEALAKRHGAVFRYGSAAASIAASAKEVALESGERLACSAVIHNGDAAAIAEGLLGGGVRSAAKRAPASARSLSAVTWSMKARTDFPLDRHNVFFSRDYKREFDEIFGGRLLPSSPTVYVCAQDRGISAPRGEERLLCLINAPPTDDPGFDFSGAARRMEEALDRCGFALDAGRAAMATPHDFAALFPGTGGALYGRASHGWMSSFQRPGARTKMPGLYLAGGSAHPGPGLPMAALSGRLAAEAILEDRASM